MNEIMEDLHAARMQLNSVVRRLEFENCLARRELSLIRARNRVSEVQALADEAVSLGVDPELVWGAFRDALIDELEG